MSALAFDVERRFDFVRAPTYLRKIPPREALGYA